MIFERWFQHQLNHSAILLRLEKKITDMEKHLEALQQKTQSENRKEQEPAKPPIMIEYLNIEKVNIDRYEQSNNFGALGIKTLEGKLNIGANYGNGEVIPKEMQKWFEEKLKNNAVKNHHKKQAGGIKYTPPKTTIRPRSGGST